MRVAGIMSGTSLDGIDVAIVDIVDQAGKRIDTVAHSTTAYSEAVRRRILNAQSPADISRLNFELGELYARAVIKACKRAKIPVESLDLIGSHGQTIHHDGPHNTLQIGEAAVIAERLGVPVVSDFRTRDIAAGGQGAPLVPFVDLLLFSRPKTKRVALNIGGIANITILPAGIAFDTGPGNMVIDQLVERLTNGKQRFDRNGSIATKGHINRTLLDSLLADKYYKAKPPKTAGREQYGSAFVDRLVGTGLPMEDLIATATALTAATIAAAIPATNQVIASGGGTHNRQLMAQLAAFLPDCRLTTTAEFGIDPDAKEAIAFAILAHRTWHHRTGNLPAATGARKPVILGKVTFQ
jgi:anhydro-N-acetylmuramic acid kinase